MAITKIHPIKSTLNLAIDYIVNGDKTDEQLLVSTHKCHESTAHTQFLRTRNAAGTKGTVLARHLIQSFLPGETSPELAHQIGMELCKKILKDEYEKESKGYEYWASKHNLHTMAESTIYIREHGIKSVKQLDEYIQTAADERQNIQEKIKAIDKEMQKLSTTMEQVHTVKKYRACYKEYKANPSDKAFFEEYKAQITLYENALSELKKSYSKLPN